MTTIGARTRSTSASSSASTEVANAVKRSLTMALLPFFGFFLVAAALAFLWKAFQGGEIKEGVVALLLVGLATLLVVELLPMLQTLKFGKDGVELEFRTFGEKVTGDADVLRDRIEALERALADGKASKPAAEKGVAGSRPAGLAWETPDRLKQPGSFRDDLRKGVFGGAASVQGFTLSATFDGPPEQAWCVVSLSVVADQTADATDVAGVEFFLHDSFPRPRVWAPFRNGRAQIDRTIWGGFTVGVWIPARDITLELDLAELPYAPKVVKEL